MNGWPSFMKLLAIAEHTPQVDSEQLKRGDLLMMETEDGERFLFVCEAPIAPPPNWASSPKGVLFLPPQTAALMGCPQAIEGAETYGCNSVGSSTIFHHQVAMEGMQVECHLPFASLGPMIDPKDSDYYFLLRIPPLARAARLHPKMIPEPARNVLRETLRQNVSRPKQSEAKINDWPGKNRGVDLKEVFDTLYLEGLVYGIRPRYWINPETGRVSKCGRPMPEAADIWQIITQYAEQYYHAVRTKQKEEEGFPLKRAAAFTWWALRLGLKPPAEFMKACQGAGLGFKTPS